MARPAVKVASIDRYIAGYSPAVRTLLKRLRATVKRAAPDAEEFISYRMPAFRLHGVLVYFAAFKHHIGLYPPIKGNAKLTADVAAYAGKKGNLRFPLDQPIPYALIARIVKFRARQNRAKANLQGKP
jgi:uncharacterized protein YdhG (YjbR/CyaY superfamily)